MVYLYETLWERRSALVVSEEEEEEEEESNGNACPLVLTRWRVDQPFAPWNSVLLTRGQAIRHERGKIDYIASQGELRLV